MPVLADGPGMSQAEGEAAAAALRALGFEDPRKESARLLKRTFASVQEEEQAWLSTRDQQRLGCKAAIPAREPFSVAFSGGGMRAAAFQAGVLWRLAAEGRLKDMEYLVGVSGGAYIASAWMSHLLQAGGPEPFEDVDKWYRGTVARAIVRMQANAGDFVRDPFNGPMREKPTDDSSILPRIFDLPLLIGAVLLALLISLGELLIVYVVPLKEVVAFAFGPALRAAVCAPQGVSPLRVLWTFSCLPSVVRVGVAAFWISFLAYVLKKIPAVEKRTELYLFLRSLRAFFKRLTVVVALSVCMIVCLPALQAWTFGANPAATQRHCFQYVSGQRAHAASGADAGCSDWIYGGMWYDRDLTKETRYKHPPPFADIFAIQLELGAHEQTVSYDHSNFTMAIGSTLEDPQATAGNHDAEHRSIISSTVSFIISFFFLAVLFTPIIPGIADHLKSVVAPLLLMVCFLFVLCIFQHRVYAPLTGQAFAVSWVPSSLRFWQTLTYTCFAAGLVLVPFYTKIRRFWHWYYARCLRQNYFAGGRSGTDFLMPFILTNPYCPFLLLTGTANDYRRPGHDDEQTSEISFSALHTGGLETGYVETPPYRTLSTCTALSGGGAVDCQALSLADKMEFRIWLELANLSWGDHIDFVENPKTKLHRMYTDTLGTNDTISEDMVHMSFLLPNLLIFGLWQVLLSVGWMLATVSTGSGCKYAPDVFFLAIFAWLVVVFLSFFGYRPELQCLLLSPMLRQLHQVSKFRAQADEPPGMLYITDGGVEDCTGIIQLMRRQCERILLVLAAADAHDDLQVFKDAMHVAVDKLHLGSFYDPSDAQADVKILLEKFKENKAMKHLHLGIRYGWSTSGSPEVKYGHLHIVKNRLPPEMATQEVRPLISEAEVTGDSNHAQHHHHHHRHHDAHDVKAKPARSSSRPHIESTQEEWGKLKETDLGGFGCCDCCHRNGGNCGAKFPHLTGANYLWLTPTLFSSLCRLGHQLSASVLTGKDGIFAQDAAGGAV
mmetsp:Transcript_48133/g.112561  ORF Transcript_48133/g.112561 Transcript_48133/m.112561 type:complete len:1004 (+) Transcript_48133:93-3104(+)